MTRRTQLAGLTAATLTVAPAQRMPSREIEVLRSAGRSRIRVLAGVMEWRLRPAETGDLYFALESFVPPQFGVPPHSHPEYESFIVLDGEVEFGRMEGDKIQWTAARRGDTVSIPGHVMHTWRSASPQPARLLVSGPARLGEFFEAAGVPVTAGEKLGPPTSAEVERVMAIAARYGHKFAAR